MSGRRRLSSEWRDNLEVSSEDEWRWVMFSDECRACISTDDRLREDTPELHTTQIREEIEPPSNHTHLPFRLFESRRRALWLELVGTGLSPRPFHENSSIDPRLLITTCPKAAVLELIWPSECAAVRSHPPGRCHTAMAPVLRWAKQSLGYTPLIVTSNLSEALLKFCVETVPACRANKRSTKSRETHRSDKRTVFVRTQFNTSGLHASEQIADLQANILRIPELPVMSALEPASFLHWLLHRCEATHFLTEYTCLGYTAVKYFLFPQPTSRGAVGWCATDLGYGSFGFESRPSPAKLSSIKPGDVKKPYTIQFIGTELTKGQWWRNDYGARLPPRRSGSIPGGFTPGFSHVGVMLNDATCRRVFSGYSRFPRPCISAPLHHNVMSGDDGHLRVPDGKPVTRHRIKTARRLKTGLRPKEEYNSPHEVSSRNTKLFSPLGGTRKSMFVLKFDKIDFKRVCTEVAFTIRSEFIRHAPDDSMPIADLQRITKAHEAGRALVTLGSARLGSEQTSELHALLNRDVRSEDERRGAQRGQTPPKTN
ncbi:hypothetical protein PR048_021849 [Dryococelus australis]|uniref:Uncharacterized protein n=1 Tax=Dryococelus australis TaxID=614101 RepID=A0ABQ9GZD2_9NEOP|nr:hypothetical protein PR048_021849 [Dryococelus australis]